MIEREIGNAFEGFFRDVNSDGKIVLKKKKDSYADDILFIREALGGISNNEVATLLYVTRETLYRWLKHCIPEHYNVNVIESYVKIAAELNKAGGDISLLLRRPILGGKSFIQKISANRARKENNDLAAMLKELTLIQIKERSAYEKAKSNGESGCL